MEKFMLIFQGDQMAEMSPEEMQSQTQKWMEWVAKLQKAGRYVEGEPLLPGGKLVSGLNSVTDGPYAEGKEVVGGYFVVEAKDFDEAVHYCQDYPAFGYGGTVQVRQVMKLEMP